MSDLVLGSTTVLSDSSGTPTIQSGVAFPAGHILQMKNATRTTSYSATSDATYENIPSFEVDITPFFQNSKILVIANFRAGNNASSNHNGNVVRFRRSIDNGGYQEIGNALQTNIKDGYGYAITHVLTHIDTPNTALPIKYTVGHADIIAAQSSSFYFGQIYGEGTEPVSEAVIMAMEIAG